MYDEPLSNNRHKLGPIDLLILQPTPFCNIDCSYCYLPNRRLADKMSIDGFQKIIEHIIASGLMAKELVLSWHAGEPMVMPLKFYRAASAILHSLDTGQSRILQSIQTNGTLVTDEWCRYFKDEEYQVGISIDGPEFIHDASRKTRSGKGTFSSVMRAVELFHKHGIAFRVIAVLTLLSLKYPDEIYSFFKSISASYVGFNIEESEGANLSQTFQDRNIQLNFRRFMERLYELQGDGAIRIREFTHGRENILHACLQNHYTGPLRSTSILRPMSIITVGCDGSATTFSPELLGGSHPVYGDFILGNLITGTIQDMLSSPKFKKIHSDILAGVEMCKSTCHYFPLCGGGAPSNKLSENSTFASAETQYCKTQIQPVIDIALSNFEKEVYSRIPSVTSTTGGSQ